MAGLVNKWLEMASAAGPEQAAWLASKKRLAMEQLQGLNEPNRKTELWRYADAGRLQQAIDVADAVTGFEPEVDATASTVVIELSEAGFRLQGEQPDWLSIKSIDTMDESNWHDVSFDQETVVNLANSALFNTGVYLAIEAHEQPLNLTLLYRFENPANWQYVRNQLKVAKGAQLNFKEQHFNGRINVVNVFELAVESQLKRVQDIRLNSSQQFISYNQFEVTDEVSVLNMNHHIGGSLQHHNHVVNFNGIKAKYQSGSINKSFDNNNISDIVKVNHNNKNNQSDVTHRSIAKDQSQIFNNAKAVVAVGADLSEIEQDLKNILLSEDAKIFSKPELEVYADEVIAAHGSTIGALDEQTLFYLQSRGIDLEQARRIMIESFEQEALVC